MKLKQIDKEIQVVQCCYCKSNKLNNPNYSFYNVSNNIAHGCTACQNYIENNS